MKIVDDFLKPDKWALLLVNEDEKELRYELAVGNDSKVLSDQRVKLGEGVSGYVAESGEPVVVTNASKDARFSGRTLWESGAQSIVAVPLRVQDRSLGVLELFDSVGANGFPQSDLSLLESLADFTAIALENARYVMKVHSWSITDERTGLYNGLHLDFILDTEIYRSHRYGYEFSLVHINLTELNEPNDLAKSLDYLSFTRLLNEIGQAMKAHGRLIDYAFRCDEGDIMFLLPQTTKETCCNVARRLHKLIRETRWLQGEGLNIHLTASIGLASYPADSRTKEGLLQAAQEAVYLVKNARHDGVAAANIGFLSPL
jgi:diguanylate cyclase (GGDEF)-like protein